MKTPLAGAPAAARSPVTVLIPAYMEEARIAGTVAAARALPQVQRVLVIDDGSRDGTGRQARQAGADVVSIRHGGKGAALRAGLAATPGDAQEIVLLLDADLGASAGAAAALLEPLFAGTADLAIARFPRQGGKAGFGLVKGLARSGCRLLTGCRLEAPLSGQRACRRWVLEASPIADGYGVEVAMNVAAGDAGARVVEIPVAMTHRATGRDWRGFRHRGRQFVDAAGALLSAALGKTGQPVLGPVAPQRVAAWLLAVLLPLLAGMTAGWPWPALFVPAALAAISGILLAAVGSGLLQARKVNYRRRVIPALGGLALAPVCVWVGLLSITDIRDYYPGPCRFLPWGYAALALFLMGWLCLGVYDDLYGDTRRKGFRGHLAALRRGTFTAGGVKVAAGGLLALAAATGMTALLGRPWYRILVDAPLIALAANALNLFDLRPGRALKVSWACLLPLALCTLPRDAGLALLALATLLVTLLYAPLDFAGMMMLGDTGANTLGAAIGLLLAFVLPFPGDLLALAILIALHVYAEHASITRLIERRPLLRWLDRLGRPEERDGLPADDNSSPHGARVY